MTRMARPMRDGRARTLAAILTAAAILAGCRGGQATGELRSVSFGPDPVMLMADFPTVVYSHQDGDTSFILTDVPLSELLTGRVADGQVMHIDLLWTPRAGATPMDASATNASIRYIVMSAGELGVYGGAGFAMPGGTPGAPRLNVVVRDTSVRLMESTEGFEDLLSPSRTVGSFTAELDPARALKLRRAMSQVVTNALGRTTFVKVDVEASSSPGARAPRGM